MAPAGAGLFVAYRDRSPEEIRDISYLRRVDGRWTEPRTIDEDGWHLTGCPVNGPRVAAGENRLAVAWFTAAGGDPRVRVALSEDGGRSFSAPIRVDDGDALGRADVELAGNAVLVSWLARSKEKDGEVRARLVSFDGKLTEVVGVARTGSDRASGFPRMASFRDEIFVAWTESTSRRGPSRIRLARLVLE